MTMIRDGRVISKTVKPTGPDPAMEMKIRLMKEMMRKRKESLREAMSKGKRRGPIARGRVAPRGKKYPAGGYSKPTRLPRKDVLEDVMGMRP